MEIFETIISIFLMITTDTIFISLVVLNLLPDRKFWVSRTWYILDHIQKQYSTTFDLQKYQLPMIQPIHLWKYPNVIRVWFDFLLYTCIFEFDIKVDYF